MSKVILISYMSNLHRKLDPQHLMLIIFVESIYQILRIIKLALVVLLLTTNHDQNYDSKIMIKTTNYFT